MTSIRATLLRWLSAGVLLAIAVAASLVYVQARDEANELFDYQMRQMAQSMPPQPFGPLAGGRLFGYDVGEDVVIQIWDRNGLRVYQSHEQASLPDRARLGFATVATPRGEWRVFSAQLGATIVQVAQPMSARQALARRVALRTVAPLLLVLPVLGWLVWLSIGRGLAPVARIAGEVQSRHAESMAPIDTTGLPQEVLPLAEALNDLLGRLERALAMQRDFVADAAHELRSPLAALKLQVGLAARARDGEARAAALADLDRGVERAAHLVQQLLTLARHEPGGGTTPALAPVDLAEIAALVVTEREPAASAKGVDLGLVSEGECVLTGEREGLHALAGNLVDNAIRYTPGGGTIDVRVARDGDDVVLEVIDTGPGIPAKELERVFDRFYRVPGGGAGSGLGLAIVRRIADEHGARVEIANRPQGGLRASVRFPFARAGRAS